MRYRLYIPNEVKDAIRDHIAAAVKSAIESYASASEDEDTMTGHLGAKLQIGPQHVVVPPRSERPAGTWTWSVTYYKFRGNGPRATESFLGADGIFEIKLALGDHMDTKSLLFQAKMDGDGGARLFEQSIRLSTWREAAFVLNYAELGFSALSLDEVIGSRGSLRDFSNAKPLGTFLGGDFLDCEIGDTELRYDARARRLVWRATNGEMVAAVFLIKHRVSIKVQAPMRGLAVPGVDRLVSPEELHKYRMQASDEEILGVGRAAAAPAIRASQKRLALAYHPDRISQRDPLLREIMNSRIQEVNDAAARVRAKRGDDR